MEAGSWRGLGRNEAKDLLRLITCGSVDDGKSTLIGRLLHDSQLIMDDQLQALAVDSARYGTTGNELDFALLVDGLEAEREQGITIDVAYRFFTTPQRSFMVADTPGHEQYTRNMATGASNAQLAIILVDARKGVLLQTRRHSFICALLGIRHVVLAVNKIDLVDYGKAAFERIVADYEAFASALGFVSAVPIPLSARLGDNVIARSANTSWYDGPCLLDYLESIDVQSEMKGRPFRFPVQWVNRPDSEFRGYAGTVASGRIAPGDDIVVAPSGQLSRVARIVTADGDRDGAVAGDAVTITLADEIDIGRGDMLARPAERPEVTDQFAAHVIWMDQDALVPGRSYVLRIGTQSAVSASVTTIKYKIDVNTREHLATHTLALNEIGFCNLATALPVSFDAYEANRRTGSFIVIDRYTNRTVGAGMIAFALRRAANIAWQPLAVGKKDRAGLKSQKPCIVWFTGLSGAGKSTIANLVDQKLFAMAHHTMLLDGDNVRHGLNRDLGFTEADRVENIRRAGEVAKLMVDAGLIVIGSFISPYKAERDMVRGLVGEGEFIEVFVDTPLEECVQRDPKGLYSKAKAGKIKNFTGIDAPYESPEAPEVHLRTTGSSPDELADRIIKALIDRGNL
ncbi:sulfate adenylyltransferase subunit CysN [Bradyrhizobium sp.]|jgi:bifunctional enzyme CysN/CysC|uniref:sulfate adenylyltransferase subunit CysN n=1 Tax=Bradyrhizobium sp. TaxID=376 RepID=UPI002CEE83FF|nr:sulfate adenylyltransferase subunit CysN [Bradyrhizobium sp.]HWX63097.1 sulfate adenylyltransferase subunit CysN [Bradyrhizobium sp.]